MVLSFREIVQSIRDGIYFRRKHWLMMRRWDAAVSACAPRTREGKVRKLLFATGDPWTLRGSKGDEAVMRSVANKLRQEHGDLDISILSATDSASESARQLGYRPIQMWKHFWNPIEVGSFLEEESPDALIVLGADVMDGYYSYLTSLQLVQLFDLAHRQGVRTSVLGFSFNQSPDPRLKSAFERVSPSLVMNLRDRISLGRFQAFCKAPARLVADPAFFLEPQQSPEVLSIGEWVSARRASGDQVLVYNYHPMLFQGCPTREVQAMIGATIQAIRELLRTRALSLVLLSHDYRDDDGDDFCLSPLHEALKGEFEERVLYPRNRMSSGELKAIAGCADGVVAGRMHLAIASLGSGVPVLGLVYQSKFQGLFDHFSLPQELLVDPSDSLDPSFLRATLGRFLDDLTPLQERVRSRLPDVLGKSKLNFEPFLGVQAS